MNEAIQERADQAAPPAARALLVLGSARSGTSALAHVLELLGVELGGNLKPAKVGANDKGYFEHVDLHRCQVELFAALGSDWDVLTTRPPRFWDVPATAPMRAQLRAILEREFGGRPLWGFKDPELCVLFPMWEELLAALAIEPAPVLIARHPEEAAGSFARLRESGPQHALLVWLQTMLSAERLTRGRARALVTYAQLLSDPCATAERTGAALALTWPRPPQTLEREFAAFLDRELHRHRASAMPPGNALEELAQRFYAAFAEAAQGDGAAIARLPVVADAITTELAAAWPVLAVVGNEARSRSIAARAKREELRTLAEVERAAALRARALAEEKAAKLGAEVAELRQALTRASTVASQSRRQRKLARRLPFASVARWLRPLWRVLRRWTRRRPPA